MKRLAEKRLLAASLIAASMIASSVYAEGKSGVAKKQCTVAAQVFDINGETGTGGDGGESIQSLLPELIVENLSRSMKRNVSGKERLDSALYDLRQERLELFMKLKNATHERDGVVLLPLKAGARKRRLKAAEKTIREAKTALEDNLKKTDEEIDKYNKDLIANKSTAETVPINIYQSGDGGGEDGSALWDSGVKEVYDTDCKYTSSKYAAAAVKSEIDILIAGEVSVIEGYVSASAAVYLYPSAKEAGRAADAGSVKEISELATRLSEAVVPFITNTQNATARVKITGCGEGESVTMSCDDIVYHIKGGEADKEITMSAGLHTLSFASKGYRPVSASYSFEGGKRHTVEAVMQKAEEKEMYVHFDGLSCDDIKFDVFSNAVRQTGLDSGHSTSKIKVDGTAVLAIVFGEGVSPVQFYVPPSLAQEDAMLEVKTKAFDRNKYIDKRRRIFYLSYSALITSLIGAFYTAGKYNSMGGYESEDRMNRWKRASNICIGVSAACGAWSIYELVRYLRSASKLLPDEAKKADGAADYKDDVLFDIKLSEESIQEVQSEDTSNTSPPSEDDSSPNAPASASEREASAQ